MSVYCSCCERRNDFVMQIRFSIDIRFLTRNFALNALFCKINAIFLCYLEKNNVSFKYDKLVKEIRNRSNTDMCPLEKSVIHIDDPVIAKTALENVIQILMNQKKTKSK